MKFAKKLLLSLSTSAVLLSSVSTSLSAREEVNINFQQLAIADFVKLVAKITDKNILINYKINGTVDLITTTAVYDDELMGLLVSVLGAKGYTMVENGSVYEIVRSTEAAKHNVEVVGINGSAEGAIMVTQAIHVENENVDIVAAKVRYLISKTAKLMTMKESNTLLITDFPGNIHTIKKVIDDIASENEKIIKTVTIEHAELKGLHAQLSAIGKAIFNPKVSADKMEMLANTGINAIVLVGKRKNVKRMGTVIKDLDATQDINEVVEIYSLKNSDAKEVLATLNDVIAKQKFADPALKPNVSSNEGINSIIIVGHPNIIKGLKVILDALDKEKYQVYVQARIVEINKQEAETVGLRYGLEAGIATSSGLYTLSGNFGGSAVATSSVLSSALLGQIGDVSQMMAVGASLDFLQSNGASKTVSNPSILCVNNKESSIYVGKTLSISTGSISSAINTTNVTNSFKREDIGLTLKVKPRVSSDDKVTLETEVQLENIIGNDSNGQPVTTKQTVATQSILRHGESIIIGGLVKEFDKENISEVPFLSDIPWLGDLLFTHKSTELQQDNLIVVLTPYVIDKSDKLSKLQEALGELGRLQQEYNDDVFPKIEKKKLDITEENEDAQELSVVDVNTLTNPSKR
jgi:general secretion pathway protein D